LTNFFLFLLFFLFFKFLSLDVVVEPWIENLWGPLADICSKIYPNGVQSEGQNGVVENGKIENGTEKVTEDLKKLEVNDEQKLTPKKVTEVKSRLIINIPEQQEVLKGIPKVPDSFIKVCFFLKKRKIKE